MDPAWVADVRDQCLAAKVPFFFKQWGGVQKKKAGRVLGRRTSDQMCDSSRGAVMTGALRIYTVACGRENQADFASRVNAMRAI